MKLNLNVTKLLSLVFVLSTLFLLVVVDHPAVFADVMVTRAELDRGRLRIEGEGAAANAHIFVDGVLRGTADDQGRFRIELEDFSPSSCQVIVSDGNSSQLVLIEPCSIPPAFAALEVEPLEEPLEIPATLHQSPPPQGINEITVPADLPPGSLAEFVIEGVVVDLNEDGTEWQVGNPPVFVYPSATTRFDKNPQIGDVVRVIGVRTLGPGHIVAERITRRGLGSLPAGPAAVELGFLFSGLFTSEANNVLTIGGFRFATVELPEPTEIDPAVAEGSIVVVVFVEAAGLVPAP